MSAEKRQIHDYIQTKPPGSSTGGFFLALVPVEIPYGGAGKASRKLPQLRAL